MNNLIVSAKIIYAAFLISFSYFAILTVYTCFLAVVALMENRRRAKEDRMENYGYLFASTFTLSLSVVIPVHNEEDWVVNSVKSVLNNTYPELEIIVVNDGSDDATLQNLKDSFQLKRVERDFTEHLHYGKIHEIFQSEIYPNMTVITKDGGFKKAGAVNAGLNFARQKYVAVVDADTILEPDAFTKVMAHVQKDPDNIIGVSSYFGMVNGFKIQDGWIMERNFSHNPIIAYQNLEYLRSLVLHRTAWSRFNAMPNVAGGFGIWRRDILMQMGGYSAEFSCEDIELTFRIKDYLLENNMKEKKILMLPYYVGWTEGPANTRSLILQRNRWQRVVNETIWHYRHMIFNPRHGTFAFLTLPYYLMYEVLGIFFEIPCIILVTWGFTTGLLDINTFLAYFSFMILSQVLISLLSIFIFIRDQRIFRMRDIIYFIILSFLEFFWYRWLISFAKISGFVSSLRGVKEYDQYKRVK